MAEKTENLARLDKRIVERNMARGVVSRAELEKHLAGLKDLSDQADNIADIVYGEDKSDGVSH